jgi:hypothetical protein
MGGEPRKQSLIVKCMRFQADCFSFAASDRFILSSEGEDEMFQTEESIWMEVLPESFRHINSSVTLY